MDQPGDGQSRPAVYARSGGAMKMADRKQITGAMLPVQAGNNGAPMRALVRNRTQIFPLLPGSASRFLCTSCR